MSGLEPLAVTTALAPRARYLPPVAPQGYRVGDDESLAAALHRLTTAQFTVAIDALAEPCDDVPAAAARALDALHRIVAVLALVRSVIGDEAYRTEVTILDDTAARLDALLAGRGAIAALDRIRARFDPVLRPSTFGGLRIALDRHHMVSRLHAMSGSETVDATLHTLRRARARFAAWPIEGDAARMYGREPIPDAFASIEPGLRASYKNARAYWNTMQASGTLPDIDSWRAQTRQLGHHLDVLATLWPDVIGAMASSCAHLESALGEADEVAALRDMVATDPRLCPDPVERALLDALVSGASTELQRVAAVLGARIFVEPTKPFVARLAAYWSARDLIDR